MYFQDMDANEDGPQEEEEEEDRLARLEACIENDGHDRLIAGQFLVDILREVINSPKDIERVLAVIRKMADHPDAMVRANLMEQVPHLALLCDERDRSYFVDSQLLPLVLKFLVDKDDHVRKCSQIAVLVLIKEQLLNREVVEEQVCPAVVQLKYFFAGTIALMSKMAPLIGKEATEKYFVDRFIHLCTYEEPYFREMCAKNFGDICTVLGIESTENLLLPIFIELCRDEIWGVRMSCAEVFLSVSCACSLETRKSVLASTFADLLVDTSQWVRMSAYRVLGAFICTFAEPSVTGLDYDQHGELVLVGRQGFEFRISSPPRRDFSLLSCGVSQFRMAENMSGSYDFDFGTLENEDNSILDEDSGISKAVNPKDTEEECNSSDAIPVVSEDSGKEADEAYNAFRFWRMPFIETDLVLEPEQDEIRTNMNILDNELSSLSEKLDECSTKNLEEIKTESVISSASTPDSGWNSAGTTPPHTQSLNVLDQKLTQNLYGMKLGDAESLRRSSRDHPKQEIVPQLLLDYYVSMTDPVQAEKTNKEIAQYCAYCLPAVALTLGPSNWPYLKDAYKSLSLDVQWKVRRTVASSIHELASILGEDIATRDLAPIFEGFIKDLDEVRIGALQHLSDFLKFLRPATRNLFLPRFREFLETDNDRNWRYREELGEQLRLSISLFGPADWLKYLTPLATCLLCDKVAAVRQKALALMADLIVQLSSESHFQYALLDHLLEEFAEHSSWRRRQVFVLLCSQIASQRVLDVEVFASTVLAHLLKLSKDSVPNVGLCVARCLSADVLSTGYITPASPHFKTMKRIVDKLKTHGDSDVQYYASLHEPIETSELNSPMDSSCSSESAASS